MRHKRGGRRHNIEERKRPSSVRERIADNFEVSKELTLDVAKVTVFGTREITVENYIGVIEYTDCFIALSAKPKSIRISGEGLEIKTMSKEIVYAMGTIKKIEYI